MRTQSSVQNRRLSVVIHYASVFALTTYFYAVVRRDVPGWVALVGIALLATAVVSFVSAYIISGMWKFTWARADQLDEREVQVTRESFRKSYHIFISIALTVAIVALVIENSYFSEESFMELRSFNAVPLMFALVHFAKTLPSSIIAWNEKETYRN